MSKMMAILASVTVLVAACGGGGGGDQEEVADKLLEAAEEQDLALDEECVRDKADQLSDADADKLLEAADDDDIEEIGLSPEGEQLTTELFSCVSTEEFIDTILEQLPDEGIDKDCVREQLEELDTADLTSGEMPPELSTAMAECVSTG